MRVDDDDLPLLYQIYNNVLDMLVARDYIVHEPRLTPVQYAEDFCEGDQVNRTKLALSHIHKVERGKNIRVFFHAHTKSTGVKELHHILSALGDTRTRCIIILAAGCGLTAPAKKLINEMNKDPIHIECFSEEELMTPDFLEIGKVYKHQYHLLTDEKKKALFKRYGGTAGITTRFPAIGMNDMVARYFGMTYMDVLSCTRASETAGMYTKYQVCLYVEQLPREQAVKRIKK